jgi:hypothetical protein
MTISHFRTFLFEGLKITRSFTHSKCAQFLIGLKMVFLAIQTVVSLYEWGTHTHMQEGGAQSILTINFRVSFLKGLKRFSLDSNSAGAGASVRIRAGQNLKHLHHARIAIKGKAYAGLLNGGTGEVCGGEKLSDGSIDVDSD